MKSEKLKEIKFCRKPAAGQRFIAADLIMNSKENVIKIHRIRENLDASDGAKDEKWRDE